MQYRLSGMAMRRSGAMGAPQLLQIPKSPDAIRASDSSIFLSLSVALAKAVLLMLLLLKAFKRLA
jgi:hypothetical protein